MLASAGMEQGLSSVLHLHTWLASSSPALSGDCVLSAERCRETGCPSPLSLSDPQLPISHGLSHPKAPALGLCGQSTGPREAQELMQTVPF